jgi:YVTN family beta-propeller protein
VRPDQSGGRESAGAHLSTPSQGGGIGIWGAPTAWGGVRGALRVGTAGGWRDLSEYVTDRFSQVRQPRTLFNQTSLRQRQPLRARSCLHAHTELPNELAARPFALLAWNAQQEGRRSLMTHHRIAASLLATILTVGIAGCGKDDGPATTGSPGAVGPATNLTATIPVGKGPRRIVVDPDTHDMYVTNFDDGTVSVIDPDTHAVATTIPVGVKPWYMVVDAALHAIYVLNVGDGTVSVIDTTRQAVKATIAVGESAGSIAIDPTTHIVYVANTGKSGSISVIDTGANKVSATVPTGPYPSSMYLNPVTHTLFVTHSVDGDTAEGISAIDSTTHRVATISVDGKDGLGVFAGDPARDALFVTNPAIGNVSMINTATGSTTAVIALKGAGYRLFEIAVDPSTHLLYAATSDHGVSVIDPDTHTVAATIPVNGDSFLVAVDSDIHTLYSTSFRSGGLAVIDTIDRTVIATVPVGPAPEGLAVDPATHIVYVADSDAGTVSIIEPTR